MRSQFVELVWFSIVATGTVFIIVGLLNNHLDKQTFSMANLNTGLSAAGFVMMIFGIAQLFAMHLRKK